MLIHLFHCKTRLSMLLWKIVCGCQWNHNWFTQACTSASEANQRPRKYFSRAPKIWKSHREISGLYSWYLRTEGVMTRWDCPGQLLSFSNTWLYQNRLFHSNTHTCDILFLPYRADFLVWILLPDTTSAIKKRATTSLFLFPGLRKYDECSHNSLPSFESV